MLGAWASALGAASGSANATAASDVNLDPVLLDNRDLLSCAVTPTFCDRVVKRFVPPTETGSERYVHAPLAEAPA